MTQDPRNKGGFGGDKGQGGQGTTKQNDPSKTKNPYGQDKNRDKGDQGGKGSY